MMKSMHRALFPALICLPLLVSGCAQDGSTLSPLRENPTLKNAARAVLTGKIYDRAAIARRNNDSTALLAAAEQLEKIDPLAAAEQHVYAAVQLDHRAMQLKDAAQRQQLEAQAAQKYRQALRIAPDFPSRNADLLNALGYFLADRGSSPADFRTAEKLTRASLKIWDAAIAEVEDAPMSGPLVADRRFNRAQGPHDSLAWALFKQGRFQEARREQLAALQTAEKNAPQVGSGISADLYFHLGEIERALKNMGGARTNYQKALALEPDHAPSLEALRALAPQRSTPAPEIPAPSTPLPDGSDSDPLESSPLSAKNATGKSRANSGAEFS